MTMGRFLSDCRQLPVTSYETYVNSDLLKKFLIIFNNRLLNSFTFWA